MKLKIEIKNRFTGKILFEFETENNTVLKTLKEALSKGAYLRGADLQGAYLQGADLQGAYLQGADLQGADLQGAYLRGADLRGADLRGAYLRGADGNKLTISKTAVFSGLYKYIAMPIITDDNKHYVRLGCYTRLVSEWEENFWNNNSEFPNNGDLDSKYRKMAFDFCKQWIELNTQE
jgi:uncharacterized protein YjbI with pentapeptide repeats